ncbi:uncharacterized protein LY89DRAFT_786605 [Mollisia scopiformis]|uniref:Uncharacterized protein n=1 Tax=Mollisia scopiformis TaxID=149040 RepID=A0A194WUT9_MOLSC|nr:uncharacterized protein LY89DRAFT_786605 [Mollisia scopiformis]KUJ11733.1 hypothetical protein LY89DRAFT_786605 [Mollisia scopiformis]
MDTPLTTTSNVLSILTFLLGLLASYLTFYTLTLSASSEILAFKSDLEATKATLKSVLECCGSESCLAPVERDGGLMREIEVLERLVGELEEDEDEEEGMGGGRGGKKKGRYMGWRQVWRRVRWVGRRKEMRRRMERIVWLKMEVSVGEMDLLLRKMVAQVHVMTERFEKGDKGKVELDDLSC